MDKLLIIEDSFLIRKVIKHIATERLDCEFEFAENFAQAKEMLGHNDYFLALCDLHLPDAPNGEVIEYALSKGLPTIVLTATINEELRDRILTNGVLDYIYKENRDSYITAINLINQLIRNRKITVLVADDSRAIRSYTATQVKKLLYNVVEAEDGEQALQIIESNENIGLLITDYNMPKLNGIELIRRIRQKYSREDFPIIGLSSTSDPTVSARFIKHGANDFLMTPFIQEEFQWRVLTVVDQVMMIAKIQDAANRDYLTNLYNRRHFFSKATAAYQHAMADNLRLNVCLLDIDLFKNINDTFGHDVGDCVLIELAKKINHWLEGMTVARYGGEEFVMLIPDLDRQRASELLEAFRQDIEQSTFNKAGKQVKCTVSIGVADELTEATTIEEMINNADVALYEAKKRGRNQIKWYRQS